MPSNRTVIAAASRTPFGKYRGGISSVRPDDLLSLTFQDLLSKAPNLDPATIDEVIAGNSNGSGEDNRNVARMSALLAKIPVTVPAVSVNRLCGSGAEAIAQAARLIKSGDGEIVIAGGVESMSRAPWVLPKSDTPLDPKLSLQQTTVGWRMINSQMPVEWTASLGESAEKVGERYGISRAAQDEWAVRSHQLADAAWQKGVNDYVFEVNGVSKDECIRPDSSTEKLAKLPSAFSKAGPVTAGNSSPLNDGAVATLITTEAKAKELGLEPVGYILSSAVAALSPNEFTVAPVPAIRKALARAGKNFSDVAIFEINEAFAAMVLSVLHELPEIDHAKVNPNGGAIAIGHPIGASGARIVADLARALKARGGGVGVAAACIGVGQGIAMVIEV
jgi:acetyl-CoA acetyltransferase family protein